MKCHRCDNEITGFYLEFPREILGHRICIECYTLYETRRKALELETSKLAMEFIQEKPGPLFTEVPPEVFDLVPKAPTPPKELAEFPATLPDELFG